MKQVLLMMPSYYHFDEVIADHLLKHSGHQVKAIDTSTKIAYRHLLDRIVNLFSKVFLNRNLKPAMQQKRILEEINRLERIDYLIINRVDLIDDIVFEFVIKKATHKVLLLWDSLEKVEAPIDRFYAFDRIFSFDTEDCKRHHFIKIENFHFWEMQQPEKPLYDAVYLGTLDAREEDLKKLITYLRGNEKTVKAFLHIPSGKTIKRSEQISPLEKIIPFKESISFAKKATVIIDLAHKNQTGLSFRVFEAMSLHKKLITTNKHIANYDFYNPNNILVITDINQINIPQSFWTAPYQEINQEIVDRYAAETWVKKILSNE